MHDKPIILGGLGAFLVLATFPVWYGYAVSSNVSPPALRLPAKAPNCVESKQWMIANHPRLLNQWRNAVVRQSGKDYVSTTYGTHYEMSLTRTCIGQCHGASENFCDQCHSYANVHFECWSCHQSSTENRL